MTVHFHIQHLMKGQNSIFGKQFFVIHNPLTILPSDPVQEKETKSSVLSLDSNERSPHSHDSNLPTLPFLPLPRGFDRVS